MYTAATVNRFKPAGWPRQFLLQLVSDLTSILTVFLINVIKNKDYGNNRKWSIRVTLSPARLVFFPVIGTMIIGMTFIIVPVIVMGNVMMTITGGTSFVRAWIMEDLDRAAAIGTMNIGMTFIIVLVIVWGWGNVMMSIIGGNSFVRAWIMED